MKASEARKGDEFLGETFLGYVVQDVEFTDAEAVLHVRYHYDGATGVRTFALDDEVPLTRPEKKKEE